MDRILFIQLRQLGDILLTTPCIRAVRRAWPRAEISFLAHPMGRMILEDNPALDSLYTYEEGWAGYWRISRVLRERNFDVVVDFMANPRSALLSWSTRGKRRVGIATRRSFLYSETVPRPTGVEYIARDKLKLLRAIGIRSEDIRLDLPWNERHTGPLLKMLGESVAFRDRPVRVILSPTHRHFERRWPLERYAALADHLTQTWDAAVVWVWGPGEEDLVKQGAGLCKLPTVVAPRTSLREMAALFANCDLFIGNSNGLSHVAVAVDVPSLQLHGPTLKTAWSPNTGHHLGVQAGVEGDGPRMDQMSLELVAKRIEMMRELTMSHGRARRQTSIVLRWHGA